MVRHLLILTAVIGLAACQASGPATPAVTSSPAPLRAAPTAQVAEASAILFKRTTPAGGGQIWLVAADGTSLHQLLLGDGYDVSSWSPDGRHVALSTWHGNDAGDVFPSIVDADGTNVRELHPDPKLNCGAPVWTPDGRALGLECWNDSAPGRDGIYVEQLDGSGFHRVTFEHDVPLGFSPDGMSLLFHRESSDELLLVATSGHGGHPLGVAASRGGRWMPDGRSVVTSVAGKLVFVGDLDTGSPRILRTIEAPNGAAVEPGVSPDGKHLVFAFDLNDPNACCMSIATMNVDGSGFTEIVPIMSAEQSAPDWRTMPE